jgi:transcription termination/antitermination protein NusA
MAEKGVVAMKTELVTAISQLTAERDLPFDVIIRAIEHALAATYKRTYGTNQTGLVELDRQTGEFHVYAPKTVVITVRDSDDEISLKDAQSLPSKPGLNEIVEVEITPPEFGRIAAQTAKQTILQRIQEAERDLVYDEFVDREGEILNGIIDRVEQRGLIVNLGKAEAVLPPTEQVPRERYRIGQRLKVYLVKVDRGVRFPTLIVSRSHRGLVRRLFEVEVPEIFSGTVEMKAIAREAGSRTKVAVASRQEGIDPVGACVGVRGVRIQNIVNELNGEKIDVIEWDIDAGKFVGNALSPAVALNVSVDEPDRRATVTVPDNMLSLAIGKEGQNARLAAKLTGWRIDIRKQSDSPQAAPPEPEPVPAPPPVIEVEPDTMTMEELLNQAPAAPVMEAEDEV